MQVNRRTFTTAAVAALAAGPAISQRRSASGWYDRAIIIDGLGGTGDPYTDEGITRMSDRGWTETDESIMRYVAAAAPAVEGTR